MNDKEPRTVSTWKELVDLFEILDIRDAWAFRGQSSASWNLTTSLERATPLAPSRLYAEYAVTKEFIRRAELYRNGIPTNLSELDWLIFMQHYGAPTRLLDFTWSPYVATYFALEDALENGAIWAVDVDACTFAAKYAIRVFLPSFDVEQSEEFDFGTYVHSNFPELFWQQDTLFVLPVEPFTMTERPAIQRGTFLCPGSIQASFMENLDIIDMQHYGKDGPPVQKIIIPRGLRDEILIRLRKLGLSRETLFPGLDGLGRSIKHRIELEHRDLLDWNPSSIDVQAFRKLFRR